MLLLAGGLVVAGLIYDPVQLFQSDPPPRPAPRGTTQVAVADLESTFDVVGTLTYADSQTVAIVGAGTSQPAQTNQSDAGGVGSQGAAPDDDRMRAFEGDCVVVENRHDAAGCAGHEVGGARQKAS